MIPKGSMAIIVEELARIKFMQHCRILDTTIEIELRKSFGTERISKVGIDRIVKEFAKNMGAKDES